MKNLTIISLFLSVILSSCGETPTEEAQVETPKETEQTCLYSLDDENVVVNWTAFKLSDTVGVGGTFDSIIVTGVTENEDMIAAAKTASFEIFTSSVNSKNPERDAKISNSFFGTMINTAAITGSIVSLNEDGSGIVLLSMNGVEQEVNVDWEKTSENRLKLSTRINVPNWEAQPSLDSLNTVCSLEHTGSDGKSVLWPHVDVEVFADFTNSCDE